MHKVLPYRVFRIRNILYEAHTSWRYLLRISCKLPLLGRPTVRLVATCKQKISQSQVPTDGQAGRSKQPYSIVVARIVTFASTVPGAGFSADGKSW